MAIKFRPTDTAGIKNFWTDLHDIASMKSLYNNEDYEALSTDNKAQYLMMLYQNNDALSQRLPEEYYSEYNTADGRYALLSSLNESIIGGKMNAEQNDAAFNAIFNQAAKDEASNSWVDYIVSKNYDGDYSKFLSEYSEGKTYQDALVEMIPEQYNLSEDSFKSELERFTEMQTTMRSEYDTRYSTAYSNALEYTRQTIEHNRKQEEYDNASTLEKVLNTAYTLPAMLVLELGNVAEGLIDFTIGAAGAILAPFTGTEWSETAVKYELFALDTMLMDAVPATYISQYADENFAKTMYQVGTSIVDMAPMALNLVVPGLGTTLYYSSSAGRTFENELNQGYSFNEAVMYTVGSTAIEWATEKISGDVVFGKGLTDKWASSVATKLSSKGSFGKAVGNIITKKNVASKMLAEFFGEGLEEAISEVGSGIWHGVVTGDYTLDLESTGEAFFIGGLVGGIMAGSSSVYNKVRVNRMSVRLGNGSIIDASPTQIALLDAYITNTAEKVKNGKSLSTREQQRFDRLKDYQIVDVQGKGRKAKVSIAAVPGSFDKANPELTTENKNVTAEVDNEILNSAVKKVNSTPDESDFVGSDEEKSELVKAIYNNLDSEDQQAIENSLIVNGGLALSKAAALFGNDILVSGLKLAAEFENKTIDYFDQMGLVGADNSEFLRMSQDIRETQLNSVKTAENNRLDALNRHFSNSKFLLVKPNITGTGDAYDKYTKLESAVKMLSDITRDNKKSSANKKLGLQLFMTNSLTVPTCFIIGDTIYVNAQWLQESDIGRIKDIMISKTLCAVAYDKIGKAGTKTLLENLAVKAGITDRSPYIATQELCYAMLFVKGNTIITQLVGTDKKSSNMLIALFNDLRNRYADFSIQKTAGQALSSFVQAHEDTFGEDDIEDTETPAHDIDIEKLISEYRSQRYRAIPFVTGDTDIPEVAAAIDAMQLHFRKTFGLNKTFDITGRVDWIRELLNPDNYDNNGYSKLMDTISKYDSFDPRSDRRVFGTIVSKRSNGELLNYYLDHTCGLMVTHTGAITLMEFTSKLVKYNTIGDKIKEAKSRGATRDPLCKLSELITPYAEQKLESVFKDADVYFTFDSGSDTHAVICGTPGTKLAILCNISAKAGNEITAGGKKFVLENGELKRNSDGTYETTGEFFKINKQTADCIHEIGHAIGMMIKFNSVLGTGNLEQTWVQILKSDPRKITEFVASAREFFKIDTDSPVLEFAKCIKRDNAHLPPEKQLAAIKEYFGELLVAGNMGNDALRNALTPLATYCYFNHFVNEMFAEGLSAAVARTDTLNTELMTSGNGIDTMVYTLPEDFSKTAPYFIKILEGKHFQVTSTDVDMAIENALDSPENVTRRVYKALEDNLQNLKDELHVELDSVLIDPDFWANKITSTDAKYFKFTQSELTDALSIRYDVHYDGIAQKFKPGFIAEHVAQPYTVEPNMMEDYSAIILDGGRIVPANSVTAYGKDQAIAATVLYNSEGSGKPAMATVRLNSLRMSPERANMINKILNWADPNYRNIIAGGKTFSDLRSAVKYLSANAIKSNNADFDTLFDKLMSSAISTGRQIDYVGNVIYMTNDGKIYNSNINMDIWKREAIKMNLPEGMLGSVTDNPEGVSDALARLLDSKRVVRLYKSGSGWTTYGVPNAAQDVLLRELKAVRGDNLSFDVESNQRLFVATGSDAHIEVHSKNWKADGFIEVEWRANKWYESIRQIMTKYNISKLSDFTKLGFTQQFVVQLGNPKGITDEFINDYISSTASVQSKNILIENSPRWKNNAHLRSMQDAERYFKYVSNFGFSAESGVIYDSWLEFEKTTAKISSDESTQLQNIKLNEAFSEASRVLGRNECYRLMLNVDSFAEGRGTDISADGFALVSRELSLAKSGDSKLRETGLTKTDSEGKEQEYIPDQASLNAFLSMDNAKVHPVFKKAVADILAIRKIPDAAERDSQLSILSDSLAREEFEGIDTLRAVIANERTGKKLGEAQQLELKRAKKRVEKYKQLEPSSKEAIYERGQIIREYERLGNFRTNIVYEGGKDFYNSLLEIYRDIGMYDKAMNAKFTNLIGETENSKANKQRDKYLALNWDAVQKANPKLAVISKEDYIEHFDKQVDEARRLRQQLLSVDRNFPGWYDTYDSLMKMTEDWLNNKTETNGKTFASAQAEIENFISDWSGKKGAEFRESHVAWLNKHFNTKTDVLRAFRGYEYQASDLSRFENIPDELTPLSEFSEQAQSLYNNFASGVLPMDMLVATLSDTEDITKLQKLYGEDFIYHLQQLYNLKAAPPVGSVSEIKNSDWLAQFLSKHGASEEQVAKTILKPSTKETANTLRKNERIKYAKFAEERASRGRKWLALGNPVTDVQRRNSLRRMAEEIKNYRWRQNEDKVEYSIDLNTVAPLKGELKHAKDRYNKALTEFTAINNERLPLVSALTAIESDDWYMNAGEWSENLPEAVVSELRAYSDAIINMSLRDKFVNSLLPVYTSEINKQIARIEKTLSESTNKFDDALAEAKTRASELDGLQKAEAFWSNRIEELKQELRKEDIPEDLLTRAVIEEYPDEWNELGDIRRDIRAILAKPSVGDIERKIETTKAISAGYESMLTRLKRQQKALVAGGAEAANTIISLDRRKWQKQLESANEMLENSEPGSDEYRQATRDISEATDQISRIERYAIVKNANALSAEAIAARDSRIEQLKKSIAVINEQYTKAEKELALAEAGYKTTEYSTIKKDGKYVAEKTKQSASERITRVNKEYTNSIVDNLAAELKAFPTRIANGVLKVYVSPGSKRKLAFVEQTLKNYGNFTKSSAEIAVDKALHQIPRSKRYKVMSAIMDAYYNFIDDPATDRSISAFENNVMTALETAKFNATIPGDTKRALKTVDVPEIYKLPLKAGGVAITESDINERLKHIFRAELVDPSNISIIEEMEEFRKNIEWLDDEIEASVNANENPALVALMKERTGFRRRQRNYRNATIVSQGEYNIFYNQKEHTFTDSYGQPVNEDLVQKGRLPVKEYAKYLDDQIDMRIDDGVFLVDEEGKVRHRDSNRIFMYPWEFDPSSKYYKKLSSKTATSEDTFEFEEGLDVGDFEGEGEPDEGDFVGNASQASLEPLDIIIPTAQHTPKGTWYETGTTSQTVELSKNTKHILSYKPKGYSGGNFKMNSIDFIADNAVELNTFEDNADDMRNFVDWVDSNPSIPLNSPEEANILALLNKVLVSLNAPSQVKSKAQDLVNALGSRGGRTLGMIKRHGVTPAAQFANVVQQLFNDLSDEEIKTLKLAAKNQELAIKAKNYELADRQMQYIMDIVKAHQDKLPVSMNIFAKGITDEQRTARMNNILNRITTWRYFAMLSSPSTFFTKNIASNIIITGMNKMAEFIASKLPGNKLLSKTYTLERGKADKYFADIYGLTHKQEKKIRDDITKMVTSEIAGNNPVTEQQAEQIKHEAETRAQRQINEHYATRHILSTADATTILKNAGMTTDDIKLINLAKFTKSMNQAIESHYKLHKHMPSHETAVGFVNSYLTKNFQQYNVNTVTSASAHTAVEKHLIDNGLLKSIMNNSVSKYDTGYEVKQSSLRDIGSDPELSLTEMSEETAGILMNAIKRDAPFKTDFMNSWYGLIFKTMEAGDKRFIEPKIKKMVESLVASNMTEAEIEALNNGDADARRKFEEFVEYATNDTLKTYFRSESNLQKTIMNMLQGHPVAQLIVGTLIPFPRMMINTMNTALSYSPVGFVKALMIASKDASMFRTLSVNKELGKAITGSALMVLGIVLAKLGWLDFDDEDEYAGVQIVIGDKYRIALSDLAPSAIPLAIGATVTHSATDGIWNGITAGANTLLDSTILGETLDIFGANKTGTDFIADSFTAYINQFIPSIMRHVARTIDPSKKQYSSSKGVKIFQRIASAIPGASLLVPSKVDPYTGKMQYQNAGASAGWARILSFANAFSPAKITADIESPVQIESEAVGARTTGPAKTYTIDGVEYTIPTDLYHDYQVLRAQLYNSYAESLIDTDRYKNMTVEQKRNALKHLQTKATEEARKQLNIGK